ncbi:MAG TPA: hypothetical protein VFH23_11290 [Jiangellaceae bacterium]|nr:hypothetical protein [Jiangellaceae bacterium]
MRGAATRLVAALWAATVVGCTAPTESAVSEPELSARILQSNFDESLASVRIQLLNDSAEPVHVNDVVLHAPPFPDAESDGDAVILPGRRIDFPVVYGQPNCSNASPTPTAATAQAAVDGRSLVVDVDDSLNVLPRLLRLYCDGHRLAEVVMVTLGERWTPDPAGDALLGTIELRRVGGDDEVTLQHLTGSVVFRLEPVQPAEPVAVLAATDDTISVPIRAKALRCDPHALAEGKKNYVFAVWLGLAGGPQQAKVELTADVGIRPTFDSLCAAPAAKGVGS